MNTLFGKFKKLILPLQLWLLGQGRCVACGRSLTKGEVMRKKDAQRELATCECGRVYMHNKKNNTYRRALAKELL
jgi:hypothetical protein